MTHAFSSPWWFLEGFFIKTIIMKAREEFLLRKYVAIQTEYYINKHIMYPGLSWKADFFTFEEFKKDAEKLLRRPYKTPKTITTVTSANSVAKQDIKVTLFSVFSLHKGIPYNQVPIHGIFR